MIAYQTFVFFFQWLLALFLMEILQKGDEVSVQVIDVDDHGDPIGNRFRWDWMDQKIKHKVFSFVNWY